MVTPSNRRPIFAGRSGDRLSAQTALTQNSLDSADYLTMKLLHIIPDIRISYGGPAATMFNMRHLWLAAGHEVQVLTIRKEGIAFPFRGGLTAVAPSSPARFANSNEAAQWLANNYSQFDLVLIHGIWTAISMRSALFLRRKRRPYVMIPHGSLDPFDLQKKSLAKRLLGPLIIRKVLAGSSSVLCSTQRSADHLVDYGAKCQRKVLPWPVLPVNIQISRQEARKQLMIRDDEFVILSLGRINYKKGFAVLLPAVKRLVQVNPKTRLLIAGPDSGGYKKVVKRMINQLGLQDNITFFPLVTGDEKVRLLRAADCFALPSLNENFGRVLVEAMQQGLPCVISNNVYICNELEKGGAAMVCNYDEIEVFAALQKISDGPEIRAEMSANAMLVARFFEPEALKERYVTMLNDLAKPRKVNNP